MDRRLLFFLVSSQLAGWTAAFLLLPILPIYVKHLGAEPVEVGYYLTATGLTLSFGPALIGWLSDRTQHRDWLTVLCALLCIPLSYGMGQTENLGWVLVQNMGLWIFGGGTINLARSIVALKFAPSYQGRAFGWLAISPSAGGVLGGLGGGWMVDQMGYPALFTALSLCFACQALLALGLKDRSVEVGGEGAVEAIAFRLPLIMFCLALVLQGMADGLGGMVIPLFLEAGDFSLSFISSSFAVRYLVSIPCALIAGVLADRLGHRPLLVAGLFIYFAALLLLSQTREAAAIMALQGLIGVPFSVVNGVAAALLVGMVPAGMVGSRISLLLLTVGLGNVLGTFCGGFALEALGSSQTLLGTAALPALACALVYFFVRGGR